MALSRRHTLGALAASALAAPALASQAASGKKVSIGISVPAADHGWTAGVIWWAKQAMALYPSIDFILMPAQNPEKQIADLETMMVKGVDGLVILATESAPLTPTARDAAAKGILVVNVDRGFLEPVADIFIEGDNKAFGRKSAQFIVDELKRRNGGKGKVIVLEGIPCTVNTDRVTAAMEVFKASPGIEIVGQASGNWNRQKALEVMETLLVKNSKVDVVWASDDDMALGAEQAIKEAGREKEIWILGGAGMKDIIKKVMDKDPMYPADITYPPSMIATGVQLAVGVLRDGKRAEVLRFMPRHLMIDVDLITPANAKSYYFPESVY
ncbi:MAG: ABC transporter substrate-binding protein [Phycisphaerae bacterium]|jgi:ribose transport system substrate-binding protein|nr:ABC transporter substrate-binding protein [Phycisphaerae bacterium]